MEKYLTKIDYILGLLLENKRINSRGKIERT